MKKTQWAEPAAYQQPESRVVRIQAETSILSGEGNGTPGPDLDYEDIEEDL